MSVPSWRERADRARSLAASIPSASGLLTFFAGLLELQERLALQSAQWTDASRLAARMPELLDFVERDGPAELGAFAAQLRPLGEPEWRNLIAVPGDDVWRRFFAIALLQPYRESRGCEAHAPAVSLLRDATDGLRRSLVCGLCQHEWNFGRIQCPNCGEQRFDALPVYSTESSEHLRIEACDTCRCYVLSVNMTKCPAAIPVVDDVGALSMHLWAQQQGYRRAHRNLFGF